MSQSALQIFFPLIDLIWKEEVTIGSIPNIMSFPKTKLTNSCTVLMVMVFVNPKDIQDV